MNIVNTVYAIRKRLKDDDLARIKSIIEKEVQRRLENENRSRSGRV